MGNTQWTSPTTLLNLIKKQIGDRPIQSVYQLDILTDSTKTIYIFGERHGKACSKASISMDKMLKTILTNDHCPQQLDIFLEQEIRSKKSTHQLLVPKKPITNTNALIKMRGEAKTVSKTSSVKRCMGTRVHNIDVRADIGMEIRSWRILKSLLRTTTTPKEAAYLNISICILVQNNILKGIHDFINSSGIITSLLSKQISKQTSEYQQKFNKIQQTISSSLSKSYNSISAAVKKYYNNPWNKQLEDAVKFKNIILSSKFNTMVEVSMASVGDAYAISRMLKEDPTNPRYMKYIVFYGGINHAQRISLSLQSVGFKLIYQASGTDGCLFLK